MSIDVSQVRSHFPALASPAVFFDNPGGTQVPHQVIDRTLEVLLTKNANHGGGFQTSRECDALVAETRRAMAEFLHARTADEIVFGPNMTTLTLSLSRALARDLKPGDEIIVTRLDHDANIAPWLWIAEDRGCTVRWLDFDVEDCTLRVDLLDSLLSERTRLVAVGYASNAVGTINPVRHIVAQARRVGAMCFVDAVQYAPHGPIDVQELDCDFLVVSAYKFFGPHAGILYGRGSLLERLRPYKVRPAPDQPPEKYETGTADFEGIAGTLGALEYLAWVGTALGAEHAEGYQGRFTGRALALKQAMAAIRAHEMDLSRLLIETLSTVPGLHIWGITDKRAFDRRVPTVSFTLKGHQPRAVAEALGREGIYVWDGNYYALAVTERLGLETSGGMVRVGLTHYNTGEEIERLGVALRKLAEA
jgi:cysteine desulfurase family protein (TIGR01976 family)